MNAQNEEHASMKQDTGEIQSFIKGLPYWISEKPAFLYPFLDGILLLLKEPVVIEVYEERGHMDTPKLVLTTGSTHGEIDAAGETIEIPSKHPARKRYLTCKYPRNAGIQNTRTSHGGKYPTNIQEVQSVLHSKAGSDFSLDLTWKGIQESINILTKNVSLPVVSKRNVHPPAFPRGDDEGYTREVDDLIKEVEAIVGQALRSQIQSGVHWLENCCNISPALHLHASVSDSIASRKRSTGYLDMPLEPNLPSSDSRSEFILSGQVNRGHHSNRGRFSPSDNVQLIALRKSDIAKDASNRHVLKTSSAAVVPIHISGFPWISFLRLQPPGASETDFIRFYKDLIPRVAGQIRYGLRDLYIRKLGSIWRDIAHQAYTSTKSSPEQRIDELIREANREIGYISRFFPFNRLTLSAGKLNYFDAEVGRIHGIGIGVRIKKNDWYPKNLSYSPIELHEIVEELERILERERNRGALEFKRRAGRLKHTIRNLSPQKQLEILKTRARQPSDEKDSFLIGVEEVDALERALNMYKITVDIALGSSSRPPGFDSEVQSIESIVMLLVDNMRLASTLPVKLDLKFEHTHEAHFDEAFVILWNLMRNAFNAARNSKRYDESSGQVEIITRDDDHPIIAIVNDGKMDPAYVSYLKAEGEYPRKGSKRRDKGLEIVRKCMDDLRWTFSGITVTTGRTTIAIRLPE